MARFNHQQGLVSFSYPQRWAVQQAVPALGNTFAVSDPATLAGMQVYEISGANSAEAALSMMAQTFAPFGMYLEVTGSSQQGGVTMIQGKTTGQGTSFQWLGSFRAVRGGVIGVTIGAPDAAFFAAQAQYLQLLNTVQFAQ
jgi:hypothetical protein